MSRAGRVRTAVARVLAEFARRRPVRLRLTLVYSSLFLLAGTVLLVVTYGLVAQNLNSTPPPTTTSKAGANYYAEALKICAPGGKITTAAQQASCKEKANSYLQGAAKISAADQRTQILDHLLYVSLAALALMAVISALLGWIVAGRALRPVHAITAAARRASEENLGERIALTGPADELKELADTFDAMLARLEAAFASQRRFVANASHELRTPLTVMRTAIDVTLAKPNRTPVQLEAMAAEVRQAAEKAEALIEALLTLARSDRGLGSRDRLDVAVHAEDALDAAAPAIRAQSLKVQTALRPGTSVGDPVLVERLVTNLVDNAVRHNVPDGWIQVATGTRDGMVFIDVANGGSPIPESEVPALFEPFRRRTPDRTWSASGPVAGSGPPDGAGLGLSIVQSVVAAHHGQVTARPGAGGGLEISVLLPARG